MPIRKQNNALNSIDVARRLRRDMTWPEKLFWSKVKSKQCLNLKFRKQRPIGPFVVDFYCASIGLIIEIDGESHTDVEADSRRQHYLEQLGMKLLRYSNDDVLRDLNAVMTDLAMRLSALDNPIPPLAPPFEGGESERKSRT